MAEQRYQAVLAVIADGLSVTQAAEKTGVDPVDLAKAISDDGAADAARVLAAARFERGDERSWVKAKTAEIDAAVYEFATAGGARAYHRHLVAQSPAQLAGGTVTARRYKVSGLHADRPVGLAVDSSALHGAIVEARVGRYVFELAATARSKHGIRKLAVTLARHQISRLG